MLTGVRRGHSVGGEERQIHGGVDLTGVEHHEALDDPFALPAVGEPPGLLGLRGGDPGGEAPAVRVVRGLDAPGDDAGAPSPHDRRYQLLPLSRLRDVEDAQRLPGNDDGLEARWLQSPLDGGQRHIHHGVVGEGVVEDEDEGGVLCGGAVGQVPRARRAIGARAGGDARSPDHGLLHGDPAPVRGDRRRRVLARGQIRQVHHRPVAGRKGQWHRSAHAGLAHRRHRDLAWVVGAVEHRHRCAAITDGGTSGAEPAGREQVAL